MTLVYASELKRFSAGERKYAFLIPSSMVLELDNEVRSILDALEDGPKPIEALTTSPGAEGALRELARVGAVHRDGAPDIPLTQLATPPEPPPLSTIVLNVTNSCNLSCRYCYEYGEDRLEEPAPAQVMSVETARQSVDTLFAESGRNDKLQITFFGGETLLNFKVIGPTVDYARQRAREEGKFVDFSLTTNATLLTRKISQWLADNRIGVTVSIDGPKEIQDSMRVYGKTGMGSYDIVAPRIKELLSIYTTRPIGARVTLTSKVIDVPKIFHHLTEEMGFYEVGFAPVTSSTGLDYAIDGNGLDQLLEQFRALGERYVEAALAGKYLGFANLSDMLGEIHEGVAKAYPCGAGLGLLGVAPGGEIGLCHRFAGSGDHDFGHVKTGVDASKRIEHLERGHIDKRIDCSTCWVRSLCSGGCYHEAQVRYGDRFRPNLHYCDWIREWTAMGLEVYAKLLDGNPEFLDRFDQRKVA
ncbi:MAG: quinohemoprotein amine dehydrogenase maturation protein [Acidobacteria bacterium]|nr:MAG: quinohemoprotein amine dehydrogenase maturation protein [Acidobacteriota bacterium]